MSLAGYVMHVILNTDSVHQVEFTCNECDRYFFIYE